MHEASESQFLCHVHQFENDILNVQNMIGIIQLSFQYGDNLADCKWQTMAIMISNWVDLKLKQ